MAAIGRLVGKLVRDRHGRVVLYQRPNLPLIVWVLAEAASWPLRGRVEHIARLVATGALLLWALLEILQGANYFRRAIGLAVLVAILLHI